MEFEEQPSIYGEVKAIAKTDERILEHLKLYNMDYIMASLY